MFTNKTALKSQHKPGQNRAENVLQPLRKNL